MFPGRYFTKKINFLFTCLMILCLQTTKFLTEARTVIHVLHSQFRYNKVGLSEAFTPSKDSSLASSRIGGGAVGLEGPFSQFICEDSYFYNNFAAAGGAILLEDADLLKVSRSEFVGQRSVLGGAIAALNSKIKMQVINTDFKENVARKGGAVFLEWFSRLGRDDTLVRKYLLDSIVFPDSVLQFRHVSFVENHAYEAGGALDLSGLVFRCHFCVFERNMVKTALGSPAGEGGAIRIRDAAAMVLDHNLIKSCSGKAGGGVFLKGSILIAKSSSWIGNHAENVGGAIFGDYADSSPVGNITAIELLDSHFINNTVGRAGMFIRGPMFH